MHENSSHYITRDWMFKCRKWANQRCVLCFFVCVCFSLPFRGHALEFEMTQHKKTITVSGRERWQSMCEQFSGFVWSRDHIHKNTHLTYLNHSTSNGMIVVVALSRSSDRWNLFFYIIWNNNKTFTRFNDCMISSQSHE